jgi:enoyl-CoA hydratase
MPVRYEVAGKIAYFTFDRPEKHNAVDPEMMEEFEQGILDFTADSSVAVAIITGAGDEAFCVGVDLAKTAPLVTANKIPSPPTRRVLTLKGAEVWKPLIAAVNGYCLGGGTELLLGTDIRVASENASFGLPEVRWAMTPRGGGAVRLPRQIPYAVAMEMLLTGETISAQRAYEVGLVNRVVKFDDLMSVAEGYASKICENGPLAIRAIKETSQRTCGVPLMYAYEIDFRLAEPVFASEDAREGPRAFSEKRKPTYKGA